jgi:DNA-binding response OmpR family regulator
MRIGRFILEQPDVFYGFRILWTPEATMAHLLIVDDQPTILQMLQKLFEQQGYEVSLAANGREALRAFQANRIDLVVTDILMPDMEGIETIRELRKLDPDVKIIAMSGGGTVQANEYLHMAAMFGARRTIQKPFEIRVILEAVRACLKE